MSIRNLEEYKMLKKYGKKLGREKLAERVLFCINKMLKDQHYQGVIEFVGRMKAIATTCKSDTYWNEKCMNGYYKEIDDLHTLSEFNENYYYGYGRIE